MHFIINNFISSDSGLFLIIVIIAAISSSVFSTIVGNQFSSMLIYDNIIGELLNYHDFFYKNQALF